jgi:UrcA family protein
MNNLIKTQSNFAKLMVAVSFLALGCTAIGGNARAQQPTAAEGPAEHANNASTTSLVAYPVRYSDLDVFKIKGTKTLYLRIRYAAEQVCESAATWGKKEGEACVRKAVNDAVARADVPLLSQYHQLCSKRDKAGLIQLAKVN